MVIGVNFIKKINQRIFELASKLGTKSDAYERVVAQITKVADVPMEIRHRNSKGNEIDVFQIPNTKENRDRILSSKQLVTSDKLPSTAKEILESQARTFVKIKEKAKKKYIAEYGKKPKSNELIEYTRKVDRYNKLLSEKAQEFYRYNVKGSLDNRFNGKSLDERINILESLTNEPVEVRDESEIPDILGDYNI